MRRVMVVEERLAREVKKGWLLWDENGSWREVVGLGEEWEHKESGTKGPTILFGLGPAVLRLTRGRKSVVLRRLVDENKR